MNFSLTPAGCLLLLALLTGCSQVQEAQRSNATVATATQTVQQMERQLAQSEQRQLERSSRGDTLSLHYKELEKFLPTQVAGFVREGEPQGESVSLGGVSYSTCEQHYRKGEQRLKVQLVDYNGANALYAGATALMGTGISQDSDEQLMQGCDLGMPGVRGYETLQKKEHRATVALGVGDRFFVSVESTQQQDTKLVKHVVQVLDLKRLAQL